MSELEPLVALLEQQQAAAAADAQLQRARFEFARKVLLRLHRLRLDGKAAVDEVSRRLFTRVVDATAEHGTEDRGPLVLQIASLRSQIGDWRQALAELRPLTREGAHRGKAMDQMFQICLQERCIAEAGPIFEEVERNLTAKADVLAHAEVLRYRVALWTMAGVLDGAANAMAAFRDLPLDPKNEKHAALLKLAGGSERDVLLATERYEAALKAALPIAALAEQEGHVQRARLAVALAHIRLGDDASALPILTALAATTATSHGKRAVIELALLALRANQPEVARQHLIAAHKKPLLKCDEHELNALTWVTLTDLAAGTAPFVEPEALRTALRAMLDWHFVQWEAIPPTVTGVAFLQLGVRRDLLAALCALTMHSDRTARGVEDCLDFILATEARGSTARAKGITAKRFAAVRASVAPPNGALLVYLPALSASFVFVVTATDMTGVRLGPDVRLRRDVRALRELIGSPTLAALPELRAAANVVADWCLPPQVQAALADCNEIAIVGRELATGLPFELMPWQDTWFGCAKAIWNVPSMTLEHAASLRAPTTRALDVAVLAATALTAADAAKFAVSAIPSTGEELTAVAAAVATEQTAVVLAASRAELLLGAGAKAKVAVVLAHGITDPSRPRPFGLLLAATPEEASGALFADDITNAADVLLLGSCQLGRGSARRGEDGGHRIGGAFLQAGARAVVLGDGDLGLAPTLVIARAFVRELAGGASTAVALQRARRETAATHGFEHPWFHCQLRLEGAGQWRVALASAAPPSPPRPWWPWFLAGALVVGATVARAFTARRRLAN